MSGSAGTSSSVQGKIAAYAPIGPTTPDTAIHVIRTPDTSVNTYQGTGGDLAAEAQARQDADTNEANARKAADAQLQTNINNEATLRAYIQTELDNTNTALNNLIVQVQNLIVQVNNTITALNNEINTRAAADNNLQANINNNFNYLNSQVVNLWNAVNTINTRLANAGIP